MDYKLAVVILTAVACFSLKDNSVLAQSECTLVENTSDKCHSANYIKILEQEVHKGMEKRIKLPGRQREIRWLCGSLEERTAWDTPANQLRITYQSDGTVRWSVYDCPDLSGPTKAGLRCDVPETTEFFLNLMEQTPVLVSPSWRSQLLMWIRRLRQYQSLGLWEQR